MSGFYVEKCKTHVFFLSKIKFAIFKKCIINVTLFVKYSVVWENEYQIIYRAFHNAGTRLH